MDILKSFTVHPAANPPRELVKDPSTVEGLHLVPRPGTLLAEGPDHLHRLWIDRTTKFPSPYPCGKRMVIASGPVHEAEDECRHRRSRSGMAGCTRGRPAGLAYRESLSWSVRDVEVQLAAFGRWFLVLAAACPASKDLWCHAKLRPSPLVVEACPSTG